MLNAEQMRLSRLLPITRVFDVTPLDLLGIPVWAAVTPLAADLTVHMGVGWTADAAVEGAVFEAVERVTAERVPEGRTLRASFDELRARRGRNAVVDPASPELPSETGYTPDAAIEWVSGRDIMSDDEVLVPRDAVISPASDGICLGPETAGLAAGPTLQAATSHALLDLVERDALGLDEIAVAHRAAEWEPRMVDPRGVSPAVDELIDQLETSRAAVRTRPATSASRRTTRSLFWRSPAPPDSVCSLGRRQTPRGDLPPVPLRGARIRRRGGGPGMVMSFLRIVAVVALARRVSAIVTAAG